MRQVRRVLLPLLLLWTCALAVAGSQDRRGWSEGVVAAEAPAVIAGPQVHKGLELPAALVAKIEGPTVLFYFSPTCPHCRHVAAEVVELAGRLAEVAPMLGIASAGASEADLLEFRLTYNVNFPIHQDRGRQIGSALGIRTTPSALLVTPSQTPGRVDVIELWYPYRPGSGAMVEGRAKKDIFAAFDKGRYLGNEACAACHAVEFNSWGLTHHSVAWQTLVKRNRQDDASCNGCHVTGKDQPTGWDGSPHSRLVDVGCESCHGPGGPHDGEPTDPRSTCVGCHDAKHSIAFTVEKGLPLIDHFRAGHMTEAGFRAARQALLDGEVPRQLLAFPAGRNLGAVACKGCHEAEYAHWLGTPHGRAMGTLAAKQQHTDAACVRCHATPRRSGLPSTQIEDFHVDEGVSCESCHGPGEAHVAAGGGKENIEKLGDGCPECVIEAVCTTCHTADQDPDWNLHTDLPKVSHGAAAN